MKTGAIKKAGIILACISLLFLSCDFSDLYPEISDIGWVMENIDDSYWSSSSTPHSVNINFWINFEESELTSENIETITITNPLGRYWLFDDADFIDYYFDAENKVFGGWMRLYSSYYDGDLLPIGDYEFEVTYINNSTVSKIFTVPAPGMQTTNDMIYVYTEDTGSSEITAQSTPLPKRATVTAATNDTTNSETTISFYVNDSKIYNGFVWFYDASGDYIGGTGNFRDFSTGTLSSLINSGSSFNTDGSENTLTIPFSEIGFGSGYSGSDIYSFRIVLTDGKQYISSDTNGYDTRSISAKYSAEY